MQIKFDFDLTFGDKSKCLGTCWPQLQEYVFDLVPQAGQNILYTEVDKFKGVL